MEKFQEIDIKLIEDPVRYKESKQININVDMNNQNNENIKITVPVIPHKNNEAECKKIYIIKIIIFFSKSYAL